MHKIVVPLLAALAAGIPGGDAHARGPRAKAKAFAYSFGAAQGRLGAQVQSMTDELRAHFGAPGGAGVLVAQVGKEGPAARAGVRVGDVIVQVDGKAIDQPWDVLSALAGKKNGESVAMEIVRDKKRVRMTAQIDGDHHGSAIDDSQLLVPPGKDDHGFEFRMPAMPPMMQGGRLGKQLERLEEKLTDIQKRLENLEKK